MMISIIDVLELLYKLGYRYVAKGTDEDAVLTAYVLEPVMLEDGSDYVSPGISLMLLDIVELGFISGYCTKIDYLHDMFVSLAENDNGYICFTDFIKGMNVSEFQVKKEGLLETENGNEVLNVPYHLEFIHSLCGLGIEEYTFPVKDILDNLSDLLELLTSSSNLCDEVTYLDILYRNGYTFLKRTSSGSIFAYTNDPDAKKGLETNGIKLQIEDFDELSMVSRARVYSTMVQPLMYSLILLHSDIRFLMSMYMILKAYLEDGYSSIKVVFKDDSDDATCLVSSLDGLKTTEFIMSDEDLQEKVFMIQFFENDGLPVIISSVIKQLENVFPQLS